MSPSESPTLALNQVPDSTLVSSDIPACVGCYPNDYCSQNPAHVPEVEEDIPQEVLPCAILPNISTVRELRAYEYNRRQVKEATKLDKARQRKQAARFHVQLIGGSGFNRKARKEIGAGVKRVRGRSVASLLLEDVTDVFADDYSDDDYSVLEGTASEGEETSMYRDSTGWKSWPAPHASYCDSDTLHDSSECDSHSPFSESDSESEDRRDLPRYTRSWRRSFVPRYCSTCCSIFDDSIDDLIPDPISTYYPNEMAPNSDSSSLNSFPNVSAIREVRAYEYKRDLVKRTAKSARLRERKRRGRILESDGLNLKGRKQDRFRVFSLDLDAPEDFEEECTVPLEVSLSSILSEELSSRPFNMSDLVPTVKIKMGKEPGFEFVPQVRAVIALDDPVQDLDFEDSQWEHVWLDDLLDEPLSCVCAASF